VIRRSTRKYRGVTQVFGYILINFNADEMSDDEIYEDEISGTAELDQKHVSVKDGEERDRACVRDTIEGFCLSTGRPSVRKLRGGDGSLDVEKTKTFLRAQIVSELSRLLVTTDFTKSDGSRSFILD
jgi:hypothetical protein